MHDTIAFFEKKGKIKLTDDDRNLVWYADFLEFVKNEKIFARLMTPAGYGPEGTRTLHRKPNNSPTFRVILYFRD